MGLGPLRAALFVLAVSLAGVLSASAEPGRRSPGDEPPAPKRERESYPLTSLDREILTEAGYVVTDESVVQRDGGLMNHAALHTLLLELKAERRRKVMSKVRAAKEKGADGGPELSKLLADNWELVGGEERGELNGWLEARGLPPVRGPDLRKFRVPFPGPAREDVSEPPEPPAPGDWDTRLAPPGLRLAPASEVRRRIEFVDGAVYKDPVSGRDVPYAPEVKSALREIMTTASEQDGAAVIRLLSEHKPPIHTDPALVAPFAQAHADKGDEDGPPELRGYHVVMPAYMSFAPNKSDPKAHPVKLPFPTAEAYRKIGLDPPSFQALDPNAEPSNVVHRGKVDILVFKDGSTRIKPTPQNQAGLLLHELLHLETDAAGAGGNNAVNEFRSFMAQNRVYYNQSAMEGITNRPGFGKGWSWLEDPKRFREDILRAYSSDEVGEVRPGEETAAGQLQNVEARLALKGPAFDQAREAELRERHAMELRKKEAVVTALVEMGSLDPAKARLAKDRMRAESEAAERKSLASAWDYRKELEDQRRRLLNDIALEKKIFADDDAFHAALEKGRRHPGLAGGRR